MTSLPILPRLLLRLLLDEDEETGYASTLQTLYAQRRTTENRVRADLWLWRQVIQSIPRHHGARLIWNLMLMKNYARNALRLLSKQRLYAAINIGGLSVGLAVGIFIFLYLSYETHYDTHHPDADRIYRTLVTIQSPSFTNNLGGTDTDTAETLKHSLPLIEWATFTCIHNVASQIKSGEHLFKEDPRHLLYADADFLKIFSVKFRYGDPATALVAPHSVVITQETAKRYFGTENALNQTVTIDMQDYQVTGIIEAPPGNSIFQYRLLRSWNIIENPGETEQQSGRFGGFYQTFVKLQKGADPTVVAEQIKTVLTPDYQDYLTKTNAKIQITLQPLRDLHFLPDMQFELPAEGKTLYLWLFAVIALLTLGLSTINFVNLSTARAANRAGEVGVRKTLGARRGQLMAQFMGESFLNVAAALAIALVLVNVLMPAFNALTQTRVQFASLMHPKGIGALLLLFIVESVAAGLYPALVLSAFKPITVLKGQAQSGVKSGKMRSLLVTSQFAASILLVIVALVFNQQLRYMKNRPLGFKKEQVVVIDFIRHFSGYNPLTVKDEFLKNPSVIDACFSTSIPGRWLYPWNLYPTGQEKTNTRPIQVMAVDKDFFDLYGIDLIAGRPFHDIKDNRAFILNEMAMRTFGWETPEEALSNSMNEDWPIVGIMKNFHITGLQSALGPAAFFYSPVGVYLSLKIDGRHIPETLAYIRETYNRLFPDKYCDAFFLGDDFNRLYIKEDQTGRLFNLFTLLAMIIACLGLLGLSAFIAQQKTKEIGIRKVLGASTLGIMGLLTSRFLKWVLLSNLVAWPLAWMAGRKILRDFAYHIDLSWGLFAAAGLGTLLIALLAVGFQTVKAALANPVKNLRYE